MRMNQKLPLDRVPPTDGGCSRRQFCGAAGLGLVAVGAAACGVGSPRIDVGPLDDAGLDPTLTDAGNSAPPDLWRGQGTPHDLSMGQPPPPDLAQVGKSCPSGQLRVGAVSAVAVGTGKHFTDNRTYDIYLCRDARGIFAMDASCTHAGCTVVARSGGWYCPCHGARFAFDGNQPTSPAFTPLQHYAVCIDGSGVAEVDLNTAVDSGLRY